MTTQASRHYLVSDEVELVNIREVAGQAPEWRLTETDQTDPAGRYRLQLSGDVLSIQRAASAAWATNTQLLNFSSTAIVVNEGGGDWDFRIEGDNNANMVVVDAGTDSMALGGAVVAGAPLTLNGSAQARTRATSVGWAVHNPAATFIDNSTTRTVAVGARIFVGIPTFQNSTLGNTLTVTDGATLTIAGAAVASLIGDGTVVLTRAHALHVIAGRTYLGGNLQLTDDLIALLGTDADIALAHSAAGVLANTALASVLVGTPVAQAVAANSVLLSNITANGDLGFYGNLGGNSLQWLLYDTSASRVYSWPDGVAGLDWTSATATFASAASTANQVLTVQNTSNAAAASHSYIDIAVGGTTSTGDPQLRWTIPGSTFGIWYAGPDNSDAADRFFIGAGTAVGTTSVLRLDQATTSFATLDGRLTLMSMGFTASDGATANMLNLYIPAVTLTLAGTTTTTNTSSMIRIEAMTIAQSGGAVIVSFYAGIQVEAARTGASVTITNNAAIYVASAGAQTGVSTNVHGIWIDAQTTGGTSNSQITLVTGAPTVAAIGDTVQFTARDFGIGDARLYIQAEAGSAIIIGNDTVRATWATQAVADATVDLGAVVGSVYSLVRITSSLRHKELLGSWSLDTRAIYRLRLEDWESRALDFGRPGWSPIAEWAYEANPAFAQVDEDGQPLGINWYNLNTAVLAEVQGHEARITALEQDEEVAQIKRQMAELAKRLKALEPV